MRANNKNRTLLPEIDRQTLFERPLFDEFQRAEYFAFTANELAIAQQRRGLPEQILGLLQTGYFKATRAFFTFTPEESQEDAEFLRRRYFPEQRGAPARPVRRAEGLAHRQAILRLFGYRLCSSQDQLVTAEGARQIVRLPVTPAFVITELIAWLDQYHIVRPGYTTFQSIISTALSEERQRLTAPIEAGTTDDVKAALQRLLKRDESLSQLASIKQDAKYFGPHMMGRERGQRPTPEPVYTPSPSIL